MREQKYLWLLLALNILLAGACVAYLFLSGGKSSGTGPHVAAQTNAANTKLLPAPVQANSIFNWENVTSEAYPTYLRTLREAGCPEERVRQIALSDIGEFIARKKMRDAIVFDVEWWRQEPLLVPIPYLQEKSRGWEEERRTLIEKLLGPEALQAAPDSPLELSDVHLTGAVLGSLPTAVQQQVQNICVRSLARIDELVWNCVREGQTLNAMALARLREQTRSELRQVLTGEQMEEFLLRYSYNAQELRAELCRFEPTATEFRKIFRAIDPMEVRFQLEYGELGALSEKEQQRYWRQRDQAICEVLAPERQQAYLLSKTRLSVIQPPDNRRVMK